MSTTSQPFGLRPAFSPSGVVRPTAYSILTGYAANILQNQPVKIGTNGTIQAAAIGDRFIGTFQGVEFTDSDSRRRVSNKWTASTAGTDIVAYVTLDPSIVYEIQANGSIAVTDIGKQADYTAISAGSTTTGLSALMLDTATLTAFERAVISTIDGVHINNGIAVRSESDPLLSHPYVVQFLQAGVTTPDADKLDRNIIRQLVHKKILFEHDNIAFHVDTLMSLRPVLEQLWKQHPEGFTMANLRDALTITRKHALPLGNCLDKVGLTKRQGDVRIAGAAW